MSDELIIRNGETVTINVAAMQDELTALRARVKELESLLRDCETLIDWRDPLQEKVRAAIAKAEGSSPSA